MKIALVAPPYLSVPPFGYGGTEKIVSLLAEGLVARGHDVTLFASGDSKTKAKLVSIFPKALGNNGLMKGDPLPALLQYHECLKREGEFDIIHSHGQYLGLFVFDHAKTPVVHTWHGSFFDREVPDAKREVLATFAKANYVSISDNQRTAMPALNYVATVYNGIDLDLYPFSPKPGFAAKPGFERHYLLWVGRITEKKGPLEAIQVAEALGMPLKLAATIDPIDQPYFEREIQPHIDGKLVELLGELTVEALAAAYGNARATLFPIRWHEPFGLVMAESMACGTPVVAYNMGSVPEVVVDGKTGFVVQPEGSSTSDVAATSDVGVIQTTGIPGLVEAVKRIGEIDRAACRRRVEEHFTKELMVEGYEAVYTKLVKR